MNENEDSANADIIRQREVVKDILKDMTSGDVSLRDDLKIDDLILRFQSAVKLQSQAGFVP
jgi:hypothetical protein